MVCESPSFACVIFFSSDTRISRRLACYLVSPYLQGNTHTHTRTQQNSNPAPCKCHLLLFLKRQQWINGQHRVAYNPSNKIPIISVFLFCNYYPCTTDGWLFWLQYIQLKRRQTLICFEWGNSTTHLHTTNIIIITKLGGGKFRAIAFPTNSCYPPRWTQRRLWP